MNHLARVLIWSGGNGWKMAEATDPASEVREVNVRLEVEGNDDDGYHLVITPDECLAADYWYPSRREAIDAAREMFGAPTDSGTAKQPRED